MTKQKHIDPRSKLTLGDPVHLMSLGFGSGLSARAPGTVGTLASVPVVSLMHILPLGWYIVWTLFFAVLGVYLCDKTSKDLGVHDHPAIVWDEFVGFMITCIALPIGWAWLLLAFAVFRFFDIVKPWPISAIDARVSGGLGIMLDDIVAGLMSLVVVQTVIFFL